MSSEKTKARTELAPGLLPQPLGWDQWSKHFFSECSNVAYQIRREWGIENHASKYSVHTHTLDPWGGAKGLNHYCFLKAVMLHIK